MIDAGIAITGPEVIHVTDREVREMMTDELRTLQRLRPAPGVAVSVLERHAQADVLIRIRPEVPCITEVAP